MRDSAAAKIGAVIMAAGAGQRMGYRPKSLLRREGEPLLLRQVRLLRQVDIPNIVVVLGHHAEHLVPVLRQVHAVPAVQPAAGQDANAAPGLCWVVNPTPDAGPGSSLRCGLSALPPDLSAIMVMLGDQPLLEAEDVAAMLTAWHARGPDIELVLPEHDGQPGHPIVFSPAVRQAGMQQTGGAGVRDWRRAHPDCVHALPVAHARYTTDIDTPQDIERLHAQTGVELTSAWVWHRGQ
jgi:CTP:molybdopterin cytidylyltransferase MocA